MSRSVSKPPDLRWPSGSRSPLYGLPPDVVASDQRRRILAAVGEEIAAAGFDRLSVTGIARRAAISRRTFYDLYADKDEAFAAAHQRAFAALADRLESARATRPEWPQRVREALAAGLDFAAANPDGALLVLADPFAVGQHAVALCERLFGLLVPALRRGRALCAAEPSPALEEGLLGGLLAVVAGRLAGGRPASLPTLAPALTRFILAPYLGEAEAERIAGAQMRGERSRLRSLTHP